MIHSFTVATTLVLLPMAALGQAVPAISQGGYNAQDQSVIHRENLAAPFATKADSARLDAEIARALATERAKLDATFAAAGSPAMRTAMARAADVRNLRDWLLPADGTDASAALARLCTTIPGDIRAVLYGSWTWASSVTGCSGRNLMVEGDGAGVTMVSTSASGILLDVTAGVGQHVTVRGLSLTSTSASGTMALLRVTYPYVPSSSKASVVVEDVELVSPSDPTAPGAVCKAVMLDGAWQARISRVTLTGKPVTPGAPGCALLDLKESIQTTVMHSGQYWGDALVYQSGYAEGLTLQDNSVVGSNWLVNQNLAGITRRANLTLLGLWMNSNEVSTQKGGLNLTAVQGAFVQGTEWTKWTQTGDPWVGYDLTDVQILTATGDAFIGGINPPSVTAIRQRQSGGPVAAGNNVWSAPTMGGTVGVGVDFGPGVQQSMVRDMRAEPGVTAVLDAGYANDITVRTLQGAVGHYGNASILGNIGQVLLGVTNVPAAANALVVTSAVAGSSPILGVAGTDANIPLAINTKGIGPIVLNTGNGTTLVARPDGAGTQVNYGVVQSGSGTNAVVYTGSSGSNVVVAPGPGGGALGLSGIPTCPAATTGQLCSAGSGQPVMVK